MRPGSLSAILTISAKRSPTRTKDNDDTGLGNLTQCRTFEEFKDAAERAFLLNKLREFDWNVSETARAVEMPRSNLYKKIERYSLSREHS